MFRRLLYFGFGFLLSILLLSLGPNNRLKETFVAYVNYFDMDKRVMYHLDKGEDTIFSKLAECQIECYNLFLIHFDRKSNESYIQVCLVA